MRINDFRTAVEVAVSVFTRELALTHVQDEYTEDQLWFLFSKYVEELGVGVIKQREDNNQAF